MKTVIVFYEHIGVGDESPLVTAGEVFLPAEQVESLRVLGATAFELTTKSGRTYRNYDTDPARVLRALGWLS